MINESGFYRLSRWCHIFLKDGVAAFCHSITLAVVFLSEAVGQKLRLMGRHKHPRKELQDLLGLDSLETLIDFKLVVSTEENEMNLLFEVRSRLMQEISLEMMYLLLTDHCNLKCRYCFEDASLVSGSFKSKMMTMETAERSVEYFAELAQKYGNVAKQKIIHLYGGEPLLNQPALRAAIVKIDQLKQTGLLPADCHKVIITNGTLLTDELAEFLGERRVKVGISIDGPHEINNLYRVAKNASLDVFVKAKQSYHLLKKHGVDTGLSVTLTPEVIANFDAVVDCFLADFVPCDGMSFNILHFNPAVCVGEEYFEAVADCLIRAFDRLRHMGIYEERMMRKAWAFTDQETIFADCGVIGNQIVISPEGLIGVCQDFIKPRTYFGGSVFDENYDPFSSGLFAGWRTRSPLFMEKCFDCEALGICGGGCPASVEIKTGNRWNIDSRVCAHSKLSLKWLIWDTYSKMSIQQTKEI